MGIMGWRRRESQPSIHYDRLMDGDDDRLSEERTPKGYVPMLVGSEEGEMERVLVHVRLLKDPCIAAALEMAAQEFGYRREGIIRIPCDVQQFRDVVNRISKAKCHRRSLVS